MLVDPKNPTNSVKIETKNVKMLGGNATKSKKKAFGNSAYD